MAQGEGFLQVGIPLERPYFFVIIILATIAVLVAINTCTSITKKVAITIIPQTLITLCPFCHSCLHIGHAGINKLGSLLLLREEIDQAKLNRALLENASLKFLLI